MPARMRPTAGPSPTGLLAGIGSRRPVISDIGDVIGYEFAIPQLVIDRLNQSNDARVKAAHIAVPLTSAGLVSRSARIGFARLPAQWLDPAALPVTDSKGVWICIDTLTGHGAASVDRGQVAQCIAQFQAAGAKVGWSVDPDSSPASDFAVPRDFVVLQQGNLPLAALLTAREAWPAPLQALPILATDLRSEEDLELALQRGMTYVCGTFQKSDAAPVQRVPPDVFRLTTLMNRLMSDADLQVIVNDIKGDVGLSYRLLTLMKSARFSGRHAALNVEQAVLTLGRDELHRILSVMLLRHVGARKVSGALEEIALWRSRFLELLAIERLEPVPGHFFALGLVSMLGPLLKQDPAALIENIAMADPAKQALLTGDGPWGTYLRIATDLEAQRLDPDSILAHDFGGADRIHALSDGAWVWAQEQSKRN